MDGQPAGNGGVKLNPDDNSEPDKKNQPVRSRWSPKPDQIMILESIFNSGTVNPSKHETVRIRKLLEKFGPVGDANVFYWFQNRRSRSRRKQRQIQASLAAEPPPPPTGGAFHYANTMAGDFGTSSLPNYPMNAGSSLICYGGSSSSSLSSTDTGAGNVGVSVTDDFFSFSGHQELDPNWAFGPSGASGLHYQPGMMTVFINGVATEIGNGPLDMKGMFGEAFLLVHSSGLLPLHVNQFGFLVQSLHHGETYFLVPRHS